MPCCTKVFETVVTGIKAIEAAMKLSAKTRREKEKVATFILDTVVIVAGSEPNNEVKDFASARWMAN